VGHPRRAHVVQVFRAGHRPETRRIVTEPDGGGLLNLRLQPRWLNLRLQPR